MSADYAEKRTALNRAIQIMETWNKKVPLAYNGKIPESVTALREILEDYKQQDLPWPQNCQATLGDDMRCSVCGWNAKTQSYERIQDYDERKP